MPTATSSVSFSFSSPPPRDRTGEVTPSGSDIPVFRGRKGMSRRMMVAELDDALDGLAHTPCSFWACEGPNRPRHMCTCCKCYAMRSVAIVKAALVRNA